jgi:sensor c-di-GMP phosphodiesterase-like protein
VIAQGVENAEQLSYLREHGCDLIQGYYFSEPLSAEEFLELLERGKPLLSVLAPDWWAWDASPHILESRY